MSEPTRVERIEWLLQVELPLSPDSASITRAAADIEREEVAPLVERNRLLQIERDELWQDTIDQLDEIGKQNDQIAERERACLDTQAQLKREEQKNEKLAATNVKLNKRANEADSLRAQVGKLTEERNILDLALDRQGVALETESELESEIASLRSALTAQAALAAAKDAALRDLQERVVSVMRLDQYEAVTEPSRVWWERVVGIIDAAIALTPETVRARAEAEQALLKAADEVCLFMGREASDLSVWQEFFDARERLAAVDALAVLPPK